MHDIVQFILLFSQHSFVYTVELKWLEHLLNHENMFSTGVVRVMGVNHSARSGGKIESQSL